MSKKKYNKEDAARIDALVEEYQQGNEEAGYELLAVYGADPRVDKATLYIGKYFKLLRYGRMIWSDRDSRMFMKCFFNDTHILNALDKPYQEASVKKAVRKKLQHIQDCLSDMGDDDLLQELRILFLNQAKRYQKTNRNFGAYIYNSYRFAIKNWIKQSQKKEEPYVHLMGQMVRIAEDRIEDEHGFVDVDDSIFAKAPMMVLDEELGNSWVRGLTCGDEFKDLTPLQRLIIKLNYIDGMPDGKIADMMGVHINTIFRHRKRAAEIIEDTIAELKEEGLY